MTDLVNEIIEAAEKVTGVVLDKPVRDKIGAYFEYLLDYNKKVNLISRKSEDSVLATGLVETYALYEIIKDNSGQFLDVGSGGGIPGIIISIMMPDVKIDLLDSTQKKARFLNSCALNLGLENAVAVDKRFEELSVSKKYDVIFSRGVGNFEVLKEHYLKRIKNDGRVVILTGEDNSKIFKDYDIFSNPYLEGRIIVNLEK
ncbi:MAG: 16S rRNA (guanine(527)-N(7))-methyltransferase RsmG [Candidatus Delongbacteria bacterium GWF2_40_14]|nr:MAG: 16S rRNA (guanine(527)-N(7))-methyltransferase RsmG [Candidatus Delongbacteria bacterium GWF2_40_14]